MLRQLTRLVASPFQGPLLGLLLCQCQSTGAAENQVVIRIGTWNIEHLGARTKFRNPKYPDSPLDRTPAEIAAVAKFIAAMQVDVLAVQEIFDEAALDRLVAHLGDDYRFVLGTTGVFDDTRISVGFLWNRRRVQLLQCEEMLDFPRSVGGLAVFHRKPVNAAFRVLLPDGTTGLDFRAITVHLKASRGRKNQRKRSAEVQILSDYLHQLAERAGEDTDIVVLGDFNHTYGAPACRVFTAGDRVRYEPQAPKPDASQGASQSAGKKLAPTIIWFDQPIDHLATTAGLADEIIPGTLRVHNQGVDYRLTGTALDASKAAWRRVYSDHFPVTIELAATLDRDPTATFAPTVHALHARDAPSARRSPSLPNHPDQPHRQQDKK